MFLNMHDCFSNSASKICFLRSKFYNPPPLSISSQLNMRMFLEGCEKLWANYCYIYIVYRDHIIGDGWCFRKHVKVISKNPIRTSSYWERLTFIKSTLCQFLESYHRQSYTFEMASRYSFVPRLEAISACEEELDALRKHAKKLYRRPNVQNLHRYTFEEWYLQKKRDWRK